MTKLDKKQLLNSIIEELTRIRDRDDIDSFANIVSIKSLLYDLEQEKVITLDDMCDLEIYLLGILTLIRK